MQPGPQLDWPAPPLDYYLLENPWLAVIGLVTVIAALLLIGYRTGSRRPRIAAAVVGCIAVAVIALAFAVTTDREQIEEKTEALVRAAIVPVDIETFRRTLSKDARLFDRDYDSLLAGIERGLDRWHVRSAYITGLKVDQPDATHGRVYLAVLTRLDSTLGGGSILTRWLLHWKKESDAVWRITKIEWLSIGDDPAQPHDLP